MSKNLKTFANAWLSASVGVILTMIEATVTTLVISVQMSVTSTEASSSAGRRYPAVAQRKERMPSQSVLK